MQHALFVYGSLMIPSSATRALGRTIARGDYEPALLRRFRRAWRVRVPVWSATLECPVNGVFLDIRPAKGCYVSGLMLRVSAEELEGLRLREAQYIERDVSEDICGGKIEDAVVTFVGKPAACRESRTYPSYVPQKYISRIERECRLRGSAFLAEFRETTDAVRLGTFDGAYKFLDPDQASKV